MCKSMYVILICAVAFGCGVTAFERSTFQGRLRYCKWFCAVRDSQIKNTIQTCYVLADHQNMTVTKCVNRCLIRHEEDLSNSTECQCQGGKCTGKSVVGSSSTSKPALNLTASISATTEPPFTENSSDISSNIEITSTQIPTEESSSQRFIENDEFEYDEETIS